MAAAANVAPNPYVTVLFKSINLREFDMKFTFYPFKEADCKTIDLIIKSFREHYLPGWSNIVQGDGANTALLSLPHFCGETISHLRKHTLTSIINIKKCHSRSFELR
jgi:hypothetical protein